MRNIILALIAAFVVSVIAFKGAKPDAYTPVRFYDGTGEITNTYLQDLKIWQAVVTPTTANGYEINIASAGFTDIKFIQIIPARNTSTATDIPDVAIKSVAMDKITVNIKTGNTQLVGVLGVNIVSNIFPAAMTGITLYVRVAGK